MSFELDDSFNLSLFDDDFDYPISNRVIEVEKHSDSSNIIKDKIIPQIDMSEIDIGDEIQIFLNGKNFISFIDLRINFFHLTSLNKIIYLAFCYGVSLDFLNTILVNRFCDNKLVKRSSLRKRFVSDINILSKNIDNRILISNCSVMSASVNCLKALKRKIVIKKGYYNDLKVIDVSKVDDEVLSDISNKMVRCVFSNKIICENINSIKLKRKKFSSSDKGKGLEKDGDGGSFEISFLEKIMLFQNPELLLKNKDLLRNLVKVSEMDIDEISLTESDIKLLGEQEKNMELGLENKVKEMEQKMNEIKFLYLEKPVGYYTLGLTNKNKEKILMERNPKAKGIVFNKDPKINLKIIEKYEKLKMRTSKSLIQIAKKVLEANKGSSAYQVLIPETKDWNHPVYDFLDNFNDDFDDFLKFISHDEDNKDSNVDLKVIYLEKNVLNDTKVREFEKEKLLNVERDKIKEFSSSYINKLMSNMPQHIKELKEKKSRVNSLVLKRKIAKEILKKAQPLLLEQDLNKEFKYNQLTKKKKLISKEQGVRNYPKHKLVDVIKTENRFECLMEEENTSDLVQNTEYDIDDIKDWDDMSFASSVPIEVKEVIPDRIDYENSFEIFSTLENFEDIYRSKSMKKEGITIPKGKGRYYLILTAKLIKLIREGKYKKNIDKDIHHVRGCMVKYAAGNVYRLIKESNQGDNKIESKHLRNFLL